MKIKNKKLFTIAIIAIILAIICFTMNVGAKESSETYGGDAYTGIQQASAQAANNIYHLSKIARFGFGSILLVSGLLIGYKSLDPIEETETLKQNKPTSEKEKQEVVELKSTDVWICDCGTENDGKFCTNCGKEQS